MKQNEGWTCSWNVLSPISVHHIVHQTTQVSLNFWFFKMQSSLSVFLDRFEEKYSIFVIQELMWGAQKFPVSKTLSCKYSSTCIRIQQRRVLQDLEWYRLFYTIQYLPSLPSWMELEHQLCSMTALPNFARCCEYPDHWSRLKADIGLVWKRLSSRKYSIAIESLFASWCIAYYGFNILSRCTFSPSAISKLHLISCYCLSYARWSGASNYKAIFVPFSHIEWPLRYMP